jgi:hypothetical protein
VIGVGATSSERTMDHLSILARRSPIVAGDPRMTDAEFVPDRSSDPLDPLAGCWVSSAG